jgi:ankyrin repeat protein
MTARHFPVRPNLEQLRHQAKDLLKQIRTGDPGALAELREHHPQRPTPNSTKLADAQLTLARSYGLSSWPRLVLACQLTEAIWQGETSRLHALVLRNPHLLHENATVPRSNWGPPMSYAANLGKDEIVTMLRNLGANDVQHAFERACLQGRLETARRLLSMGGRPALGTVMGPCETLNPSGLSLLLKLGAELADPSGDRLAPIGLLLQTYSRYPEGKHRCLDIVERQGINLPDTPTMAVHRGRIDLLEAHLRRDPDLFSRTFSHQEIYPPGLGCNSDESLALHGTPLAGSTLLHMCVDFDEIEIARWMLHRGANANAPAAIDPEGFGGHTPLFGCVVSQSYRANCRMDDEFARLLLDAGANTELRASLQKRLRFVEDETMHVYLNVTPLEWGEQFHDKDWISKSVMDLLRQRRTTG